MKIGDRYKLTTNLTTLGNVRFCRGDVVEITGTHPAEMDPGGKAVNAPSIQIKLRTADGRSFIASGPHFLDLVASKVLPNGRTTRDLMAEALVAQQIESGRRGGVKSGEVRHGSDKVGLVP